MGLRRKGLDQGLGESVARDLVRESIGVSATGLGGSLEEGSSEGPDNCPRAPCRRSHIEPCKGVERVLFRRPWQVGRMAEEPTGGSIFTKV